VQDRMLQRALQETVPRTIARRRGVEPHLAGRRPSVDDSRTDGLEREVVSGLQIQRPRRDRGVARRDDARGERDHDGHAPTGQDSAPSTAASHADPCYGSTSCHREVTPRYRRPVPRTRPKEPRAAKKEWAAAKSSTTAHSAVALSPEFPFATAPVLCPRRSARTVPKWHGQHKSLPRSEEHTSEL